MSEDIWVWRFGRSSRRRVPLVRQYTETDCGPACLLAVLRHHGGETSLAAIRHLAGTDTAGSSLFQLARAAERLGFDAVGASGTYDDLAREPMPVVAHVVTSDGLQHFVAVEAVRDEDVLVMDPAVGRRRLARTDFEAMWQTRAVLLLRPSAALLRTQGQPWWRWVADQLGEQQVLLVQSIALGLLYTAFGLVTSIFVRALLDDFIPSGETALVLRAGGLLVMLLLGRAAIGYARQRLVAVLQRRVSAAIHGAFVTRLFALPLSFFERTRTGDLTTRLQDCVRLQSGAIQGLSGVVIDGTVVLGVAAALALLAPSLLLVAAVGLPFYVVLLLFSVREIHQQQGRVMQAYTDAESRYLDALQGIRTLLASGARAFAVGRSRESWSTFVVAATRFAERQSGLSGLLEALGSALLVVALVLGAISVIEGRLQLGQMIAGYTLVSMLLPAIGRLADAFVAWQTTRVAGARVFDVLSVPTPEATSKEPFALRHELTLQEIEFTWPRGVTQLHGGTLTLTPGRIVALSGRNGAGKSTLLKLLRREYEPTGGALLVDGRPADHINLDSYQRAVALLAPGSPVFAGSLFDNLVLGRSDITANDVVACIQTYGLAEFFARFPHGLATPVGDGGRPLSAGEQVMVGLIRALVGRPAVLVLDEPFAVLDGDMRATLFEVVRRVSAAAAVLLVSHDPDVLAYADTTYALRDGRVALVAPMEEPSTPASVPASPAAGRTVTLAASAGR